nr:hypothetical protein [Tanacetum cinerariifolium]
MEGLDAMLENGPWFIQNHLLILKKWHLDENQLKKDVSTIPVWVNLHGVLVTTFSEDVLSAIATKLGTLLMLDSYTFDMGGRGVKEKDLNRNKTNTASGISVSTKSDDTKNEDTLVGVASAVKEGVTPFVVNMTTEMEKKSSLEDTTVMGSFPPLSMPVTTTAGNAPGKSSYANATGKPSGKKLNIRTLFTPGGNGIDVVVSMESIRAISERFANTEY